MDVDLPVWTIRPNWSQGILERLEWLTDVLGSDTGFEQRRAVRLSPRRSFEITVNPTRADRSYLDLILHRLGSEEWLFPLWHDQAVLSSSALAGQSAVLFDNTFREFRDGDYAILYASTFQWEVVQIDSQTDDGALLAVALDADWPRGSRLFPLRRCTIQTDTTLKALTSRVGESVLLFQVNESNDYAESFGDMPVFGGYPVLTIEPNRSQEITSDQVRFFDEQDGDLGVRYRTDKVGRSFAVQSHNWQLRGRQAQAAFRSFLYALRGRQGAIWLPTFNDDLILTKALPAGQNVATFEHVGMYYVGSGGPIPGRARLWTGSEMALIASLPPPQSDFEEKATLIAPVAQSYAPGASWAFLQPARLDTDTIELQHHTDSDGVMESGATFRVFADGRNGSGTNYNPIPVSAMIPGTCGVPGYEGNFDPIDLGLAFPKIGPGDPGYPGTANTFYPNAGLVVGPYTVPVDIVPYLADVRADDRFYVNGVRIYDNDNGWVRVNGGTFGHLRAGETMLIQVFDITPAGVGAGGLIHAVRA